LVDYQEARCLSEQVVHAKPEPLETEEVMSREQYEKREFERPESKLERQLTPGYAARAVEASQGVMVIILNGRY
jgi:hypothetical protein